MPATTPPSTTRSLSWLADYVGRPTPLYEAKRLSRAAGGARIFLKREDLAHTGAHKINNALGQALLAKRMGKQRIIAETGAGQHGVATATACALLGLECIVYMGEVDIARQALNVFRMKLLGAEVRRSRPASRRSRTPSTKRSATGSPTSDTTFYIIGSAAGTHPYPMIVRDFQSVIGREARAQMLEQIGASARRRRRLRRRRLERDRAFSTRSSGDDGVELIGVEAGGHGIDSRRARRHACAAARSACCTARARIVLQDECGQVIETHSISAGLDYPGVGPEHAYLKETGRAEYVTITDDEALEGFHNSAGREGIIPALESSHAVAYAMKLAAGAGPRRRTCWSIFRPGRQGSEHGR